MSASTYKVPILNFLRKLWVTQINPRVALLNTRNTASQQHDLLYYYTQSVKLILVEAMCILLLLGVALGQGGQLWHHM